MGWNYKPDREERKSMLDARSGRGQPDRQFASLKYQVIAPSSVTYVSGPGIEDLSLKLQSLRCEFENAPELCFLHAATIVKIRRGVDPLTNLSMFFDMWMAETSFLCRQLNSRWLVSAVDTYADHGDEVERPTALMISGFFNAIKLSESERLLAREPGVHQHNLPEPGVPLWDGISAYNFEKGDMLRNLIDRMRDVASNRAIFGAILETMLIRASESDTLLSRCLAVNVNKKILG
jgi:hypothetical protein